MARPPTRSASSFMSSKARQGRPWRTGAGHRHHRTCLAETQVGKRLIRSSRVG
jgi:hypothetical protein